MSDLDWASGLVEAAEIAVERPRTAKSRVTRLARSVPEAELVDFYEEACRAFVKVGERTLAGWSFAQARKAEPEPDLDRLHRVFLELTPVGGVAPTALRDYAKTLAEELSAVDAHARFREVICASFDAGLIPYARFFPDLRKLAKAAGYGAKGEEAFLAERLLRARVLHTAPPTAWEAAKPALTAVVQQDDALLDLLIAAEPDIDGDDAETARQLWLTLLADVDAGVRLSPEWFFTAGRRCSAPVLARLVDQTRGRLFPDWPAKPVDPREREADSPEEAVADVEAGHLHGLSRGLRWLDHYGGRHVGDGALRDIAFTDPVEALRELLRTGVPEELGIPLSGENGTDALTLVEHDGHLTRAVRREATAYAEGTAVASLPLPVNFGDLLPWYDGRTWHVSRQRGGHWQTFRLDGEHQRRPLLSLDPATLHARPGPPASAEVTFPGADAPSRVLVRDGRLLVLSPNGAETTRRRFSHLQRLNDRILTPGMWRARTPVDPEGSERLRAVDRDLAERLVVAALPSSDRDTDAVQRRVAGLLPEVTDPGLLLAVTRHAQTAARCLKEEHSVRDLLGMRPRLPRQPLLITRPELPVGRSLWRLVALRTVGETLREAAAEGPEPDGLVHLGQVDEIHGARLVVPGFGQLIRQLSGLLWPWNDRRETSRDILRAWANTELGDGSGRWRLHWVTPPKAGGLPGHQLWRTRNGALMTFGPRGHRSVAALEHSPTGTFEPLDLGEWKPDGEPFPQDRPVAEWLLNLERLLAENGTPPVHADHVRDLAGRGGITTGAAIRLLYGDDDGDFPVDDLEGVPAELVMEDADERPVHGNREVLDLRTGTTFATLRDKLMPDDPADLWTTGPDIDRAVAWLEGTAPSR